MGAAMTEERVYTVKQVADILQRHPRTVRRMIARGELKAFVIGDDYRIRQSALDAVMLEIDRRKQEESQDA